jgi:TetR/AcrR family transcriptional regulator, mexCD-oprJ operon repressor
MAETLSTRRSEPRRERRRRADAERSVARILDAAVEALADNPDSSVADIASRAGVARATVYAHFPTREDLIAAVTDRAMSEVIAAIEAADPDRGDADEALRRVVAETWRTLGRYHALIDINTRLPHSELHDRHRSVLATLEPLIERGQREGGFRTDVPPAWHLSMLMALIHAASAELRAGRLPAQQVERGVVETVLGAVRQPPKRAPRRMA